MTNQKHIRIVQKTILIRTILFIVFSCFFFLWVQNHLFFLRLLSFNSSRPSFLFFKIFSCPPLSSLILVNIAPCPIFRNQELISALVILSIIKGIGAVSLRHWQMKASTYHGWSMEFSRSLKKCKWSWCLDGTPTKPWGQGAFPQRSFWLS